MHPLQFDAMVTELLPSKFQDRMDESVTVKIMERIITITLKEFMEMKKFVNSILPAKAEDYVAGHYPAVTFVKFDPKGNNFVYKKKPDGPFMVKSETELEGRLIFAFLDITLDNPVELEKERLIFSKYERFLEDMEVLILLTLANGNHYRIMSDGIWDTSS